ncbi:hypothetical protein V6N13_144220 [Hibiscus sabdariffa]
MGETLVFNEVFEFGREGVFGLFGWFVYFVYFMDCSRWRLFAAPCSFSEQSTFRDDVARSGSMMLCGRVSIGWIVSNILPLKLLDLGSGRTLLELDRAANVSSIFVMWQEQLIEC